MTETFAIFCGIGIHNTKTYENACKLMAKQVKSGPFMYNIIVILYYRGLH